MSLAPVSYYGSRSHKYAVEIALRARPGKDRFGKVRRNPNSGSYGAPVGCEKAATYDEWGIFMAEVYDIEPLAKFGTSYESREDFHRQTNGRYRSTQEPIA